MQDRQRRATLHAGMAEGGFAGLVFSVPEDVLLVSGYWPVMGSSLAVVGPDGAVRVILPEDELELAKATGEAEFIAYQPGTLERMADVAAAIAQPLQEISGMGPADGRRVGMRLGAAAEAQTYQSQDHFHRALEGLVRGAWPGVEVVAADALLKHLKSVKTDAEVGRIRHLCGLARVGFDAAQKAIGVGRREDEIAAEINGAYGAVALEGFERGEGYFFCMSGPNSATAAAAFARTRRRVVEAGELVMIHANTVGDGLWSDITRTYTAGKATELQGRMRAAIDEARGAALQAIRPGARACAVDAVARNVLAARGFGKEFKHGLGHGVGFGAADPGAVPRLHPQSPDVLEAGMIFNVEPAIYIEGEGGMRHCDVLVCTGKGAEVLTDF